MRIGLFCDMFEPHISGVTEFVRTHRRELERCGHEVWVVTFGDPSDSEPDGHTVYCPGIAWGDTGWNFGLRYPAHVVDLIANLDVAHAQHPFVSAGLAHRAASKAGVPTVFTNHTRYDLYADSYALFVPSHLRRAWVRGWLRGLYRRVDAVTAPSDSTARWMEEFTGFAGARVIPGGVDVASFAGPDDGRARREMGFSADDLAYCYVGRLAPEKGVDVLLQAFAQAAEKDVRARLVLVGDGPSTDELARIAQRLGVTPRVVFAGRREHRDVVGILHACDVFVSASTSETQGLSAVEAMAAGLPVVAVDAPGYRDTIAPGTGGILTAGDARSLAEGMAALADPVTRARAGAQARARASEFDAGVTAQRMLELYRELATPGSSA